MSNSFIVTAPSTPVDVEQGGSGELAFGLSNPGPRWRKVNILVSALEPKSGGWFSLRGATERRLEAGESTSVTVEVRVPADGPPGNYGVNLLVSDVENPDAVTSGQSATLIVHRHEVVDPQRPPIWKKYWWVLLVVLGVVGLGIGIYFLTRPPGLGKSCAGGKSCAEGLTCFEEICRIPVGAACQRSVDCETAQCTDGKCAFSGIGGRCQPARCGPQLSCTNAVCLGVDGATGCARNEDCVSGLCHQGTCLRGQAMGQFCGQIPCAPPLKCVGEAGAFCLKLPGAQCAVDLECESFACNGGTCGDRADCPPIIFGNICPQICQSSGRICARRHCTSLELPAGADPNLPFGAQQTCEM